MDGQDYLNQLASTVRPDKKSRHGFLSSPIFKVLVAGIALFVLIAIIGSTLSGSRASVKEQAISLKLHIDNTLEVIAEYQPSVKSSELRSLSASLYSVLSNTNRDFADAITELYGYKAGAEDKKLVEAADLEKDELESSLFEAKINGILDQVYANKMAYEISLITTRETNLRKATGNEQLRSVLGTSYDSLNTLYGGFDDFFQNN